MQAAKDDIDIFCRFTVYANIRFLEGQTIKLEDNTQIALRADTGQYLSRWDKEGIQAAKATIDPYCLFKITHLKGQ